MIINHGDGLTSYYGHLDEFRVEAGDAVGRGQAIATVGMTGLTTGPHIHFEVRRDGERLDPGLFSRGSPLIGRICIVMIFRAAVSATDTAARKIRQVVPAPGTETLAILRPLVYFCG